MIIETIKRKFTAKRRMKWPAEFNKSFYIGENIHAEDAVHFGSMIFPDFEVKYGFVFLLECPIPNDLYSSKACNYSREDWQASYTRYSLYNLFASSDDVDSGVWISLLEIFKLGWTISLKTKFPEKEHVVCTDFEDGYEPKIWFYELEIENKQ